MHRNFFVFLLFLFPFFPWSQNHDRVVPDDSLRQRFLQAQRDYEAATRAGSKDEAREEALNRRALTAFQSLYPSLPAQNPAWDSLRFLTAFRIGELEHYFERFREALDGYQKAIEAQQGGRLPDSLLFQPYLYSGIIYYNRNAFDSAETCFRLAEDIQTAAKRPLAEGERLYNILGVLYYEKGDYRQAQNYFEKALELLPRSHPYYRELMVNYRINLAQIHFRLEDYETANRIYQELLPYGINTNEIRHNIGTINLYLGAPARALESFRQVHYTGNKLIRLWNNRGLAWMGLQRYDSAQTSFDSALAAHQRFGANSDATGHGLTLYNLGELEMERNHPRAALRYYQLALHPFYPAYTDTSVNRNPARFTGVFSYINLFNALTGKAKAWHALFSASQDLRFAEAELDAYRSAFSLIDYVERSFDSDEARLFLDKTRYLVHVKPIDICYLLYTRTNQRHYLEDLYHFDQQNKASVLSLQHQLTEGGQDTALQGRERGIRARITRLSLRAGNTGDSASLVSLERQIRDAEIELGKVQDRLDRGGSVRQIPTVDFLQKSLLDESTALVSFHLSESALTTLLIRKNAFSGFQQPLLPGFHDAVARYVKDLQEGEDREGTDSLSRVLYAFLFREVDLRGLHRLILIPDDELNYLSFESLKTPSDYLIQQYSIQYQYSTTLLRKEEGDFRGHATLAFAPFAGRGDSDTGSHLGSLPQSGEEIRGLKGESYLGDRARKSVFLSRLSHYPVLHLATHAVAANGKQGLSYIAFAPRGSAVSDYLLYEEEIYNLPLRGTGLVILSACETGSGDLVKGEGILSLSRAFSYAGCPDILTSLWQASDFSTAYLTRQVHTYLDKGLSIDAALRQAKLDYLSDRTVNPRMKHPYYWSHLVFVGNYRPEKQSISFWTYAITGLTLLVLTLALWFWRSRKQKANSAY